MAIRKNYWNDTLSSSVKDEKKFLQELLNEFNIYTDASVDDAKYLFFILPSIIIVKGYSTGFQDPIVKEMILTFILKNKESLQSKSLSKIQYHL